MAIRRHATGLPRSLSELNLPVLDPEPLTNMKFEMNEPTDLASQLDQIFERPQTSSMKCVRRFPDRYRSPCQWFRTLLIREHPGDLLGDD